MNTPVQTSEPPKTEKKGFRLYKREDSGRTLKPGAEGYRDRDYYFTFQFRGKTYTRCVQTNKEPEAQKFARALYAEITTAIIREEYSRLDGTKRRAAVTHTVRDLCKVYATCPGDACEKTRKLNQLALHQLLRTGAPDGTDTEELTITAIDDKLARTWFEAATEKANKAGDQSAAVSMKKSANSRFTQAASLFTPRAVAAYKAQGIEHAGFQRFLDAGELNKFTRLPKDQYNPPTETIIAKTLAAWAAIEDRNLFLALGHALAFGLRLHEISQARWSWWSVREGYPVLDGAATVKSGTGFLQVRALDPFFSIMQAKVHARQWRGEAEAFIITGTTTYRTDDVFRAAADWLRELGWDTMKAIHALRAYAGSQVAMRYGIYEAQTWLRHSTVKVTEQHYTHFVKRFRPSDLTTIAARWATNTPAEPMLRILPEPQVASAIN